MAQNDIEAMDIDNRQKILSKALDMLGLEVKLDPYTGWTPTGWHYGGWKFYFKDDGNPAFLNTIIFPSIRDDFTIAGERQFPDRCPYARMQYMLCYEIVGLMHSEQMATNALQQPIFSPCGREKHNPFFGCKSIEEMAIKLDLIGDV